MNSGWERLLIGLLALCPCWGATTFETTVQPFVAQYCYTCHNQEAASGGLNLQIYQSSKSFVNGRETWELVLQKLKGGEMPPPVVPRPPADRIGAVSSWLESEFARQDEAVPVNPGRVTARRLNRYEYNATVHDLLGVNFQPADDFPADDFSYGFDNIGDVLSLSPALMEKYITAAKRVARAAIDAPPEPKNPLVDHRKNLTERWPFAWNRSFPWEGDYEIRFAVPYFVDGRHDPGIIFVSIDGQPPQTYPLATEYGNEGRYQDVKLHLTSGLHELKAWAVRDDAAILADEWKKEQDRQDRAKKLLEAEKNGTVDSPVALPSGGNADGKANANAGAKANANASANAGNANENGGGLARRRVVPPEVAAKRRAELLAPPISKEEMQQKIAALRQPYIESVEVHGPYNPQPASRPDTYKRVFVCGHAPGQHTEACVRTDLAELARRAWRRPVTKGELAKLVSFAGMAHNQGDSWDEATKVGIMAILVSPNFLFRMERTPGANDPNAVRKVGAFELASRLSYFLWSSMPDQQLLGLAEQGKLSETAVLDQQVDRMLKDPKADRLVEDFGGQWLMVRNLDNIKPDPDKFPQFSGALRAAMQEETRLFFLNIMREDHSIMDFLTAKYTFANELLAKLYGIPGVTGNEFRKVDLKGTPRVGILTQAGILTVSSYATRTSPVLRGKWILENILNAPPPPPPANVPSLDASAVGTTATLREQMEMHRANPLCASCHAKMDPLGFGLENFNAIGSWRTMDGKFPIDSKGALPSGKSFTTPEQLAQLLAEDKEDFTQCLTEKLMIFALGRGLEAYDRPAIRLIARRVAEHDYRFSIMIHEIVKSPPFQMRRGEAAAPATHAAVAVHPGGLN
jgi:hypothetical protein